MAGKPDLQSLLSPALPVALTKAEALECAAVHLDGMAKGIGLSKLTLDSMNLIGVKPEALDAETREVFEALKKGLVDPKLQVDAALAAARSIRELAMEERVFAARASASTSVAK